MYNSSLPPANSQPNQLNKQQGNNVFQELLLNDLAFNSGSNPSNMPNRELNVLQRHTLNKTALQKFYQNYSNSVSYERRLHLLGDIDFNNHYKTTRYWDACKFKTNEEGNEEPEIIRIKVSNRFFNQIMTDGKEVEFDLRSATAVVLQPKSDFDFASDTLRMCAKIEKKYRDDKNEAFLSDFEQIHRKNGGAFGFFVRWHLVKAQWRIIVLVRDKFDKDKMLFIYNTESEENEPLKESKIAQSYFQNDSMDSAYMKEITKVHMCKQKNQIVLAKFKSAFSDSIKNDFKRKIDDVLQVQRDSQNKFMEKVPLIHAFRNFDRFQSEDMLNRWKIKSSQKAKDKHLMVEVAEIWIKDTTSKKSVNLTLKNYRKEARQEEYSRKFVFNRTEGEYSIYQIEESHGSKCCMFELPKGALSKEISINVEASDGRSKKTFFNNYTYYKSEGIDAFSHTLNLLDSQQSYVEAARTCFIVVKTKETRNTNLKTVEMYHQRELFDHVGQIPTKYRSSLSIDYNPNTFFTIRKLLAKNLPEKISKSSYQQCYYSLVKFIQSQENKSQLNIAGIPLEKVVDRCPMNERLGFYEKQILRVIGDINVSKALKGSPVIYESRKSTTPEQNKLAAFLSMVDQMMLTDLCGREFKVSQVLYKNLQEDIAQYKPLNEVLVNQLLVKYLHFINRVSKIKQFGYPLSYSSFLVPIIEKYILIFFNSKQASEEDVQNQTKQAVHFFVFVCFVARVYSYSDPANLRNELYILRHLAINKLPYYNDFLSRSNIGLQNLIAPHLLNLFTDLSQELTFRIWDFLMSSDNVFRARIAVAFTLLIYMQTSRNLPIIPINQFMEKVIQNYKKLHIQIDIAVQMEKGAELFFQSEKNKDKKLEKLVAGKEKTIASDKYLQRIILGDTFSDPDRQKKVEAHYQNNRTVQSIGQISYPLPRPNYFGHPITEIILFIHNLNILQNLNLMSEKYSLRITTPDAKVNRVLEIGIVSKNNYYNQSFKIPMPEGDPKEERAMVFQIIRKGVESVELEGCLNYGHYHKDKAYKAIVMLGSKAKHNKGETVLNVSFCLKSSHYNQKLEERNMLPLEALSDQVLDYDISDNNPVMRSLRELHEKFEQIKNPLDEFSTEQNKKLKNSALNYYDYAWLQNSKTTVEDIKTIFYHLFPQEKDHDLKLEFSKIYEIFSEEHHMQHIYLVEVLTKLVLALNVTRKKKLSYLYCLGVHYQNACTKKISSETINSMIRLILRQKGLVTACPYEIETCGRIVEASYFSSSLKSQEERVDFTQILQDWAYMCNLKFSFNSIILGTANNLSILRSLFDDSALGKMESQTQCRFEIVYETQGKKYLWSAIVEPKTFKIVKRGTKFLNTFDGYSELKYLDSTQEYLYNCENIIPLQAHKTYNYSEFTQVMAENQLVRYALEMPTSIIKEPPAFEYVRPRDPTEDSRASSVYGNPNQKYKLDQRVIDHPEEESYSSWALYRSQNCLQNWRRCQIVGPGPVLSEVKYADDPETYSVSTLDIISMDEIDLQGQPLKGQFF